MVSEKIFICDNLILTLNDFLDMPEKKEGMATSVSKLQEKLERKRQRKLEKKLKKQAEENNNQVDTGDQKVCIKKIFNKINLNKFDDNFRMFTRNRKRSLKCQLLRSLQNRRKPR
jgi:hypothetical protein